MKKTRAMLTRIKPIIKDGKIVDDMEMFEVRIMAIAEGYAMVRRKGCFPFICKVEEFTPQSKG